MLLVNPTYNSVRKGVEEIEQEYEAALELGFPAHFVPDTPLLFPVSGKPL